MARIEYGVEDPGFKLRDLAAPVRAVGHGVLTGVQSVGRASFLAVRAVRRLTRIEEDSEVFRWAQVASSVWVAWSHGTC